MAMDSTDSRIRRDGAPVFDDPRPAPRVGMRAGPPPAAPASALPAASPRALLPPFHGYTLMVAGRRTGKTSFLRLLLDTSIIHPSVSQDQLASVAKFVQACAGHTTHLRSVSVNVELADELSDLQEPLQLTLIDTPSLDFLDEAASNRTVQDILRHVEAKFTESVHDTHKASAGDHHVHLCIYFLDPDDVLPPSVSAPPAPLVPRARADSHSKSEPERVILEPPVPTNPTHCTPKLPPSDIITIRALSQRVNVLPVIARADTLTNERLAAVKYAIRRDLAEAGIGFGIFDVDSISQYESSELPPPKFNGEPSHGYVNGSTSSPNSPIAQSQLRLPFALISPDAYSHSDGVVRAAPSRHEIAAQYDPCYHPNSSPKRHTRSKLTLGKFVRTYRWGSMDVLDHNHCDFVYLRTAIFQHMETLQKYTREYLFERYRAESHPDLLVPPPSRHQQVPSAPHRLPPLQQASRPVLAIDTVQHAAESSRQPSLPMPRSSLNGEASASTGSAQPMSVISDLSPKTASSSRSQRQRTKKITVACNFCRSRKLKCDGGRPACSQCFKRNHSCDYTVSQKRRGNGGRRRKQFEDGVSESDGDDSADRSADLDPSASPEVPSTSKDSSRRNSKGDMAPASAMSEITLPPLMQTIDRRDDQPPGSRLPPMASSNASSALMSSASSSDARRYAGPSSSSAAANGLHDLPPIATLSSASLNGGHHEHELPPIRHAAAIEAQQQSQQGRRRTSSASTKGSRSGPGYGSKVVACNYCRTRKTKCDGGHPTCGSCARRSLQCNYVNDPTGANPKGRPRTAPGRGTTPAATAPSASGSTSLRSSPTVSLHPLPSSNAAASIYLRHLDSNNPHSQAESGDPPSDLKRPLDLDARMPISNKKMRIMDTLAPPPTATVAVAVAQIP
ncbi:hypothetical protein EIP91_006574 [Steccherinum ochraceum]|uniref:Zn(2)-C6 fungal-type domain-containing protein n=1 Tax=Steccherinum ochraceum TaxID=92696 RepID=A0A4R0R5I4_9APHY|nr:hypothetical protein EIP91_006574 [Steccherinum ochraceum]